MQDQIDPTQWQRLGELFDRAIDMEASQQAELVRTIEREDGELAGALMSLLAADARHRSTTAEHRVRLLDGSLDAIETQGIGIGDRVGPYVLRSLLGRGGMGVVFRAERVDGQVRQEVALKIVRRSLLDPAGCERFHRERQIVAEFHHPYIARMLDVGQTPDGSPWLAMELIRGLPITHWCDANRLDARRRVELFLRVCEAVQHAHSHRVLHRDLKPGNVLVGDDGVPKLIDFGIAKPLSATFDDDAPQTTTTHRFFSPNNVAPEQLLGDRVGVACDIYQLGTLLHELLCGQAVFDAHGLTPRQLEERILEEVPVALSERAARSSPAIAQSHGVPTPAAWARQLRGDLDAIVARALRKTPTDRYDSAVLLAEDLRHYLAGKPVAAMQGQRWYRTRKFLQRWKLTICLSVILIALVASLVSTVFVQSQELARERQLLQSTHPPK